MILFLPRESDKVIYTLYIIYIYNIYIPPFHLYPFNLASFQHIERTSLRFNFFIAKDAQIRVIVFSLVEDLAASARKLKFIFSRRRISGDINKMCSGLPNTKARPFLPFLPQIISGDQYPQKESLFSWVNFGKNITNISAKFFSATLAW